MSPVYFEREVTAERRFTMRADPRLEEQAPALLAAAQQLIAATDVQEPFAHLGFFASRFGDYRRPQFCAVIHDGAALAGLHAEGLRTAAALAGDGVGLPAIVVH